MYLIRRSGLGDAACPEPVPGEERDKIRERLSRYVKDWWGQRPKGIHWHEEHPDVKAFLNDIIMRMAGLEQRPKLLRCSKEARKKAGEWCDAVQELLNRVKGAGGFTVVQEPFRISVYNGPTYTIRSTNHPTVRAAMDAHIHRMTQPATPAPTTPAPTTPAPTTPAEIAPAVAPTIESLWEDVTTGQVLGIDKSYITYALIGLLGYDLIFRRLWK